MKKLTLIKLSLVGLLAMNLLGCADGYYDSSASYSSDPVVIDGEDIHQHRGGYERHHERRHYRHDPVVVDDGDSTISQHRASSGSDISQHRGGSDIAQQRSGSYGPQRHHDDQSADNHSSRDYQSHGDIQQSRGD